MIYYKHYIGDYLRDTAHLTLLEHGIYLRLIHEYFLKENSLPLEKKIIFRLIRARTKTEKELTENILSEFFDETPEGFSHKRCNDEIAVYNSKKQSAKNNANARWNNANASSENHANASVSHTVRNASHKSLVNSHIIKEVISSNNVTLYQPKNMSAPELKKAGVNVNSADKFYLNWVKESFGIQQIIDAINKARLYKKPDELIATKYIDKILRGQS